MKTRIVYIERKTGVSEAWIGRVRFSKTGKTIYYRDKELRSCGGRGIYGNYYDAKTGWCPGSADEYWVSGPKRDGSDRLFGATPIINIDDDVREEYWITIRERPECVEQRSY
jgi:hypothetical protein